MEKTEYFEISDYSAEYGPRPFILSSKRVISFQDFFQLVDDAAIQLRQKNITAGDRVALLGANSVEHLILLMALWQLEAVAVPVSERFPENQLVELLSAAGCSKIILINHAHDIELKLFNSEILSFKFQVSSFKSKVENREPRNTNHETRSPIPLEHLATIIFTSGSSGQPKAALHTIGNHYFSAAGSNENIPFGARDCWLLSLPLYHVGGLAIFFRALVGGGAIAIPEPGMTLPQTIGKSEVTHISLVATQLFRLLQSEDGRKALSRLKAILLGGSAIPRTLIQQAIELGLPIHTSYGSTEMASQITTTPPNASPDKLFTSGKCLKHREIEISADGEILVKGKTLFSGYIEDDSRKRNVDNSGWFATGDIGKIDEDGYLVVVGRKDNMFISGGENIQPEEIETCLCQMENINRAVVVAVENKEFGKRPIAFIELKKNQLIAEAAIRKFLNRYIARFKIPDYFFPWPDAVNQAGIKVDRQYFQKLAGKLVK